MKLSDKIASCHLARPFYTFEFFPPRTDQGFEHLVSRIFRLSALHPLAISITWGAGGTTKDRSLDLASFTQRQYGLDTLLHLTCTNMEKGTVDEVLRTVKERGIENILALRGDPPRGAEEWVPTDSRFIHGVDLVSYIRATPEFANAFSIGVAAYPDGHPESSLDEDTEIAYLKQKVDAGADFIITQLFYDVDRFLGWINKVREKGITVPIIPGIMPIQTYSSFQRLVKLCGTHVPPFIFEELEPISHDDQRVKDYGIDLAVRMIRRLTTEGGVKGIHFCTLNLEKSVQHVLEALQWTSASHPVHNKLIAEAPDPTISPSDSDLVVTPHNATDSAEIGLINLPDIEGEAGKGELNNAVAWDEFPNGRFGDFKSPAYGDQGPWGSLPIMKNEALANWGYPKSLSDLTNLFLYHLHGNIPTTPFSSSPLSAESQMILPYLERLNKQGWWTVGSQPAIDAARSDDPVVGWGPLGGYVFQKAFVEFFCEEEDANKLEKRVREKGGGWVHIFAGNYKGELKSNVPEDGRNAVTWGVFPGQEIVQSTIIECESFLSWKEEAFSIWSEWASFYPPDSQERKLLEGIRDRRWLVSIVHHNYKSADALWKFLFGFDEVDARDIVNGI